MKHQLRGRGKALALALGLALSMQALPVLAAETYYDQKTVETVTRGVAYEKSSRMTDAGIQNVHVLTVDLMESTLKFEAVESAAEYGLKETAKKLLTDNGAVAGVNGDFFGMSGAYSAAFGPIVRDGEVVSAGASENKNGDEYASFFMDAYNNPFFTYFKMTATFANDEKAFELASMNKITSMVYPMYFDEQIGKDTSVVDGRFHGLVKFTVENNRITNISQPGEVVNVPYGGYLVIMNEEYYNNEAFMFQVGDQISLNIESSVMLDNMKNGFSGGGKLLISGQEAPATKIVAAGRQPRTAFGVSQDGKKAIFMVVDGRGDSIGATHTEMAYLMAEYGAFDAMHLDGGGSSTMVAETVENPEMEVKNKVSDGGERKVISAVGVFQTAQQGEITQIAISPSAKRTLPNRPITFTVYGLDEYYNRIEIPAGEVTLEATGINGTWSGYDFTPGESGVFSVTAAYNEMTAEATGITSATTAKLVPSADIRINVGQTATIAMQATDIDGFNHWVSTSTAYEVENPAVGVMNGNVFTAKADGATYIKCTKDGQTAYVAVTVGLGNPTTKPKNTVAADPLVRGVSMADDGAYYLNIIGSVAYSGDKKIDETTYADTRTRVRDAVDNNANLAVYGGKSDIKTAPRLETMSWNGEYRFLNNKDTSVVMLSAAKGGIRATNPAQWANFTRDVEAANSDTVIFVMDKTPSDFSSGAETAYFRAVLNKYVEQGKKIFVVSCGGNGQWTSAKDGVRYINLPDLWTKEGGANGNFSMLKLRVNGTDVSYEISKV